MKKKTKITIGVIAAVILIAVLIAAGFMTWLVITRTNSHKFGEYLLTEGPWAMNATWVSEDSSSYLVCEKETDEQFATVTAYFQSKDGWQAYELNNMDRIAYLDTVEDGVVVDSSGGELDFDGTTFTISELDKTVFGASEFNYTVTDKEFTPD